MTSPSASRDKEGRVSAGAFCSGNGPGGFYHGQPAFLYEMRRKRKNPKAFCPLCQHNVEDMVSHLKTEEHKRHLREKARAGQMVYSEVCRGDFCLKCGGTAFCRDLEDPEDEWHCLNCGRPVIFLKK